MSPVPSKAKSTINWPVDTVPLSSVSQPTSSTSTRPAAIKPALVMTALSPTTKSSDITRDCPLPITALATKEALAVPSLSDLSVLTPLWPTPVRDRGPAGGVRATGQCDQGWVDL